MGALPLALGSTARAQSAVGDVFASDASVRGSVVLANGGTRVLSGSTISAGLSPATLRLARGGSLRVCPGTNLSVSAAPNGPALSLGFSTGALELHYDLESSADSLQTPDFRLLLAGPGSFNLAVSADALGDTCVRPLGSNTASVIVAELFGDATYQVKPGEPVVFRRGHIAGLSHDPPPDCGCPPARDADPASPIPPSDPVVPPSASPDPKPAALSVSAEAPFVYRADPGIPDPPVIAIVHISDRASALVLPLTVLPPLSRSGTETKPPPKTVLGRIRSFLAAIFK